MRLCSFRIMPFKQVVQEVAESPINPFDSLKHNPNLFGGGSACLAWLLVSAKQWIVFFVRITRTVEGRIKRSFSLIGGSYGSAKIQY